MLDTVHRTNLEFVKFQVLIMENLLISSCSGPLNILYRVHVVTAQNEPVRIKLNQPEA